MAAIAVAETFAGARGQSETHVLDDVGGDLPILLLTAGIVRGAGMLTARYGPSYGLGVAEAIMAGTAQAQGLEIVTLNTRH